MSSTRPNPTWYDYSHKSNVMCHPILPMKSSSQPKIATAVLTLFSPIFPYHTPHSFVHESRCPCTHSLVAWRLRFWVSSPPSGDKTTWMPVSNVHLHSNDTTHVVLTKVCSSFSSLPSRLASRSFVQQQASHREISELRRTIPRSECVLALPPQLLLDGVATTWVNKLSTRLC